MPIDRRHVSLVRTRIDLDALSHRVRAPAAHCPDPLPDTPGRFWASSPYWRQDGQYVRTLNAVNAQAAEGREGVAPVRLHPSVRVLVISPSRLEHRMSPPGGYCECRNRGPSLLCYRVASRRDLHSIVHDLQARRPKADIRIPSKADIAALAVDRGSLDPTLRSALGEGQVQRSAVAVQPPFRDGFDFRCC